jgi:CRP-like cAMP-binding protein
VAAGETVFQAGDLPEAIHFMSRGRLRFSRPGSPDFEREGRWVLGFQEAVSMTPRRRTAVAVTDLELLTVPAATWLEILDDRLELARDLAVELARVVATMRLSLPPDGGYLPSDAGCPARCDAMSVVERMLCLRGVPLFAGAGVQPLADLARGAREVTFERGAAPSATEGWRERLHVIVSGRIELTHEAPDLVAGFGPGELIGGAAALGPSVRAWDARALEPTRAIALPFEVWVDEVEDHFGLFRSALGALVDEREDLTDQLALRNGQRVFR